MSLKTQETAASSNRSPAQVPHAVLPRVLYALALNPAQKFGSLEEQIVFLAERFRAAGGLFTPLFVCDPAADASQFHQRGIDAHCLDLHRFSIRTLLTLRQLIRAQKIDIVHWNFLPPLSNPYVWALTALTPGLRHWFTDHNSRLFPMRAPPRGPAKWIKRLLLRRYSRVVCVSGYVETCLADQGVWSNLVSTLHFINTDRFRPDEAERARTRARLAAGDRFALVTVGHLIKEKGIDVAIRALAQLPTHVVLWIVGQGPEEASLRRLIAELRLEGRAQLLGLQQHVQPFLQAADCFVCPSLWGEAAGLVNLEAQACGTPLIASRIGGIPEYVADGRTGLLFTPGDHGELARCVRRLIDDSALRDRFARAARVHAVENFSPDARLPEWLDLYRDWRNRS